MDVDMTTGVTPSPAFNLNIIRIKRKATEAPLTSLGQSHSDYETTHRVVAEFQAMHEQSFRKKGLPNVIGTLHLLDRSRQVSRITADMVYSG